MLASPNVECRILEGGNDLVIVGLDNELVAFLTFVRERKEDSTQSLIFYSPDTDSMVSRSLR